MSGICGVVQLDGAEAFRTDTTAMASLLRRRGPDRTGVWTAGPAGLAHTLLTTTPELAREPQPVQHAASGCVITADVRLDNRQELLDALRLADRATDLGDAGLILEAYLAWGEDCAERLLGDFAFAIWHPSQRTLFCARDQFGLRPFYYHHIPNRHFYFASEPQAILTLPQVPYNINEGRIADFLVQELQWIDYTSTFFDSIVRLPPAHTATVTERGITLRRYWRLEPGPELRLASDEAYQEGLLEVLTQAIRARLRGAGSVGGMLSGGLDSSSVVTVAKELWMGAHGTSFSTFSGVGPDPASCAETRMIHHGIKMPGLAPHLIDHTRLDLLMPDLEQLTWGVDEPFDYSMAILRSVWMTASRHGVRVVLDGAGSDVALGWTTHLARLFRRGRFVDACRAGYGVDRFFGARIPGLSILQAARSGFTPQVIRSWIGPARDRSRAADAMRASFISPDFARRVALFDRFRIMDQTYDRDWKSDYHRERADSVLPNMTAGRERYNRVASETAVEPRDPFMDRRVLAFCVALPGDQTVGGGWPKVILRRAMAGRLPDAIRWNRGKPHLGPRFTEAVMRRKAEHFARNGAKGLEVLQPFVDMERFITALRKYRQGADSAIAAKVHSGLVLAAWLKRTADRSAEG